MRLATVNPFSRGGRRPNAKAKAEASRYTPQIPVAGHEKRYCKNCGKPVYYFLTYQLCDPCLRVVPNSVHLSSFYAE